MEPNNSDTIPPEFYDKIALETAEFVFRQVDTLLLDIVEVRRSVEAKANTLIATLTPTIFALFSIVTGVVNIDNAIEGTYFAAVIASLTLLGALLLCMLIAKPTPRSRVGSLPKDLFDKNWIENYPTHQTIIYIINEINSYQRRAASNLKRARRQARILLAAIILMVTAPVISGAVLILASLCGS